MMIRIFNCIFLMLLLVALSSQEEERCKPHPSQCTKDCPSSTCKYEDPFYCGCCPNTVCLQEEGDPCGGEHGDCGKGLVCKDSDSEGEERKCVKCELTTEKCADEMENCKEPEDCTYGVDPLACSCCPVCLKGPEESCNATERCAFYTKCDGGKCQEIESGVPYHKDKGIQGAGSKQSTTGIRKKGTCFLFRHCIRYRRNGKTYYRCRYYLVC